MTKQLKKIENIDFELYQKTKTILLQNNEENKKNKKDQLKKILPENIYKNYLINFKEYEIQSINNYKLKTKSKNVENIIQDISHFLYGKYKINKIFNYLWIDYYNVLKKTVENDIQNDDNTYHYRRNRQPNNSNNFLIMSRTLNINIKELITWSLHLSTGKSLYKEKAKNYLTKNQTHYLINCPFDYDFDSAIIWSIAKSYGATDSIAQKISSSKLKNYNINNNNGFYKRAIDFFVKNTPEKLNLINDLVDYFENTNKDVFSFGGQTVKSLEEKMISWHHELRRMKDFGKFNWDGTGAEDFEIEEEENGNKKIKWIFTEIKTSQELLSEGKDMHHCVYSYKDYCKNNKTFIFSMKKENEYGAIKRKVTIELNSNYEVVQAKGFANRALKSQEKNALKKWANHFGFYYKNSYII